MKKQFLFLAASALFLASCGSNNTNQGQTQAQIDSTVNAKLNEHDAANQAKNDSTLKAIEKEKADAMAKEHETKKHEGGKATPAPVPTPTVAPAPPPTVGNGKPAMGGQNNNASQNTGNTVGNGKPKMGGH